jgi:hypothetical protein
MTCLPCVHGMEARTLRVIANCPSHVCTTEAISRAYTHPKTTSSQEEHARLKSLRWRNKRRNPLQFTYSSDIHTHAICSSMGCCKTQTFECWAAHVPIMSKPMTQPNLHVIALGALIMYSCNAISGMATHCGCAQH